MKTCGCGRWSTRRGGRLKKEGWTERVITQGENGTPSVSVWTCHYCNAAKANDELVGRLKP